MYVFDFYNDYKMHKIITSDRLELYKTTLANIQEILSYSKQANFFYTYIRETFKFYDIKVFRQGTHELVEHITSLASNHNQARVNFLNLYAKKFIQDNNIKLGVVSFSTEREAFLKHCYLEISIDYNLLMLPTMNNAYTVALDKLKENNTEVWRF